MKPNSVFMAALITLLSTSVFFGEQNAEDSVFLKGGELWSRTTPDKKSIQISETNGKIASMILSPSGKNVVGLKTLRIASDPNCDPPEGMENICKDIPIPSIVVYDLKTLRLKREITSTDQLELLNFDQWVSDNEFLFYQSGGGAVAGQYHYVVSKDAVSLLDWKIYQDLKSPGWESRMKEESRLKKENEKRFKPVSK